jgi:hypothetical protein
VITQNLETLKMLDRTAIDPKSHPPLNTIPKVFDQEKRIFFLGQWIDAKNSNEQWVASFEAVRGRSNEHQRDSDSRALQRL